MSERNPHVDPAPDATAPDTTGPGQPHGRWLPKLFPAACLGVAAFLLFAMRIQLPDQLLVLRLVGYSVLAIGLISAVLIDRRLAKDLLLIAVGITIVSTTSVVADVSWPAFIRIGIVLTLALTVPFLIDRFVFKRRAITFPWRSREKKNKLEIGYIFLVPFLGWALLPFYFIRSETYLNWPNITDNSELVRFFVGVNAVGTFDELFFICTCFALFRRHFPDWVANLLQMVIFVSFLWELGYRSWGPALTIPFALLQGYLFSRTRSLGYVVIVHLLFDALVFAAIVHAHNRDFLPIFLY